VKTKKKADSQDGLHRPMIFNFFFCNKWLFESNERYSRFLEKPYKLKKEKS